MVGNVAWSERESTHVARAYISASENPAKGSDQKADLFWNDVFTRFVNFEAQCEERIESRRNLKSVLNQWSGIHHDCAKFLAIYIRLKNEEHSGWTEEVYIREAHNVYFQAELRKKYPDLRVVDGELCLANTKVVLNNNSTENDEPPTSDQNTVDLSSSPLESPEKDKNEDYLRKFSLEKLKRQLGFKYEKAFMVLRIRHRF